MCTLKYSIKNYGSDETYAVGVYIGENPRDDTFGYAVCDLIKCESGNIKDCGIPVSEYIAEQFSRHSISLEISPVVVMYMQVH